jgi:enoyl-CoA hydratase/carnithine racemase
MNDRIAIYREGGIADVRLNRPEKMNALDRGMFSALVETANDLAGDNTLRCVVLSGEGRTFCAGLDFASFQGMAGEEGGGVGDITAAEEGRITHFGQQAVYGWTTLPVPVIAAITGHALGGGIQLALGADIRVIHPNARMSILESRWGLIPDMTGTQTLIDLVGIDVAKELTFTGRMVSGAEAVELGLATHLAEDPRETAMELAREIAAKSPDAIRAAKRLFNAAPKVSLAEGFAQERAEIARLIGSPNQVEAVKAYFEKRAPEFADPE